MHRALPDARDGLKPVHRRILYAMRGLRLDPDGAFRKCAKIVGEVMGNYHPHGDQLDLRGAGAAGAGLQRPLPAGRRAGQLRQHRRRQPGGAALHRGAADRGGGGADGGAGRGRGRLPRQLRRLGAASRWCCRRRSRTCSPTARRASRSGWRPTSRRTTSTSSCDACLHLIRHPGAGDEKLLDFVQGPDFPTGGVIIEPRAAIKEAYRTGRGSFRLRARWAVEDLGRGTWQIVVTEIPYQVQKGKLIERLAELVNLKKIPILADVRDESAEDVRIVLEPRARTVDPARADGDAVQGERPRDALRDEHERADRRAHAAGLDAEGGAARLPRPPARGAAAPLALPAGRRSTRGWRCWRGCSSPTSTSTG